MPAVLPRIPAWGFGPGCNFGVLVVGQISHFWPLRTCQMTAHSFVMGYGRFDKQNTTSRNNQTGADWPALPRSVGGWPNGGGLHSPCDAQSTAAVSCHIFLYIIS